MTQLGDYHVKEPSGGTKSWLTTDGKPSWPIIGVGVAVVFTISFAAFWFLDRGGDEVSQPQAVIEAPPPTPAPTPPPTAPDPEPFNLPTLDGSNEILRELVSALSAHPGFSQWIITEDLIRTWVVVVDNVADGRNPATWVEAIQPNGNFQTMGEEPELRIDPKSFERYEPHAQIVASLDTADTADLFRALLPLMDEAYAELGYPDTPFIETFERAVVRLLATPVLEEQPTLVARVSFFEYTDATLESLTPVQKQFMGMGPDNMRVVQDKLSEIAQAIGIPSERLPSGSSLLR